MWCEYVWEVGSKVDTRVGTKDEEIPAGLRRLHNEYLNKLHFVPNIAA